MKPEIKTWLTEQFGGDETIMAEIYGEYRKTTGEKLVELKAALADGDFDKLDRVAHTIKGNALMTGDQTVADVAIALRGTSQAKDLAKSAELAAKIEELTRDMLAEEVG